MSSVPSYVLTNPPTLRPRPLPPQMLQQYDKYFAQNEPAKGGSFYLQSKVYRAKECLEREIAAEKKKAQAAKAEADEARQQNSSSRRSGGSGGGEP